jgi:hypothetical protein
MPFTIVVAVRENHHATKHAESAPELTCCRNLHDLTGAFYIIEICHHSLRQDTLLQPLCRRPHLMEK